MGSGAAWIRRGCAGRIGLSAQLEREIDSAVLKESTDPAIISYGGINFDAALLNLEIKRDSSGVPLPLSDQAFVNLAPRIKGFSPLIIDVRPFNPAHI